MKTFIPSVQKKIRDNPVNKAKLAQKIKMRTAMKSLSSPLQFSVSLFTPSISESGCNTVDSNPLQQGWDSNKIQLVRQKTSKNLLALVKNSEERSE